MQGVNRKIKIGDTLGIQLDSLRFAKCNDLEKAYGYKQYIKDYPREFYISREKAIAKGEKPPLENIFYIGFDLEGDVWEPYIPIADRYSIPHKDKWLLVQYVGKGFYKELLSDRLIFGSILTAFEDGGKHYRASTTGGLSVVSTQKEYHDKVKMLMEHPLAIWTENDIGETPSHALYEVDEELLEKYQKETVPVKDEIISSIETLEDIARKKYTQQYEEMLDYIAEKTTHKKRK